MTLAILNGMLLLMEDALGTFVEANLKLHNLADQAIDLLCSAATQPPSGMFLWRGFAFLIEDLGPAIQIPYFGDKKFALPLPRDCGHRNKRPGPRSVQRRTAHGGLP
jgi:hypothetical protein